MGITRPALLTPDHDSTGFACEHEELTAWLKHAAFKNQKSGASKTYVVCDGTAVVGYYCLAPGAVAHQEAPKKLTRNVPDPIPVILLGRLAVHQGWMGQGIGKGLLKDAVSRSIQGAEVIGGVAMLCHAIDEKAKQFYVHHGFLESPIKPLLVMLPLKKGGLS